MNTIKDFERVLDSVVPFDYFKKFVEGHVNYKYQVFLDMYKKIRMWSNKCGEMRQVEE